MKMFKWLILGCFCLGIVFYGFAQSNPKQPDMVQVGQVINGFKVISYLQHKDVPTQVAMGTPTAIVATSAVIFFVSGNANQGPTMQEIIAMENILQNMAKSKLGAKAIAKCVADNSSGQNGLKCEVKIEGS